MRYTRYSTANDVMKEFLIYGAELTEMGFPILPAVRAHPTETIDFRSGLNRSFKGHHNTSCNFYIDDEKFLALENNVDKYLNYLCHLSTSCRAALFCVFLCCDYIIPQLSTNAICNNKQIKH